MAKEYATLQEGAYRIDGTRVSLDSIVYAYRRGASPESIQRSFPSLTLEQVHGALAFYLSHQQEIEKYLTEGERNLRSCGRHLLKRIVNGTRGCAAQVLQFSNHAPSYRLESIET